MIDSNNGINGSFQENDDKFQANVVEQQEATSTMMADATAEAVATEPEAVAAEPETQTAEPEAQITEPEAQTAEPEAQTTEPEAQTAEPEAQITEPETQTTEPEAQTTEPEAVAAEPEAQTIEPEAQTTEPEAQTTEPEAQTTEPEAQTAEPEAAEEQSGPKSDQEIFDNFLKQEQLQGAYLRSFDSLAEGNIISGAVVQISDSDVFVDIGYKAEGRVPREEFKTTPEIGEKVDVILIRKEIRNGEILISHNRAVRKVAMKKIKQAFHDKDSITGLIVSCDEKMNFHVLLDGEVEAICPISQIDIQQPISPNQYLNMTAEFVIDRIYSDNKVDIILSRKHFLRVERNKKQKNFFETTKIGDIVKGTVKHFVSFGAFIDLGGFDALLHVNDISWNYVNKPKERLKKGQIIHTKVITLEPDTKRIGLSLRHLQPDPWHTFEEKYSIGQVLEGNVTKLIKTSFFVELEPGIEGLVHVSEFSWAKHPPKIKECVEVREHIKVKILDYNLQEKKITLGVKQTRENPWVSAQERYPVGMTLRAPIVKITPMGLFVKLEEEIDAFLHVKDISWTERIETNAYSVGDEVECVVLECNPIQMNVRVSIKETQENPWNQLISQYHIGSTINGTISTITDFGLMVKTEFGIEGLVHKSQLGEGKTLEDYAEEETIKVKILEILPDKNRLALSERSQDEAGSVEKYLDSKEEHAVSFSNFF